MDSFRGLAGAHVRRFALGLILLMSLAACGGGGSSIGPLPSSPEDKKAYLVSALDNILAKQQTADQPGVSILVVKDDNVIYSRSLGMADLSRREAITENTAFELASVAKPITAVAIMQLKERQLLSLNDSVLKWVPELPASWSKMTIHQLLSHQTGIPDYFSNISATQVMALDGVDNRALLQRFASNEQLNFNPGTAGDYSNTNYVILAEIIARASGKTYAQYLQDNIFTPTSMRSSFAIGANAPVGVTIALNQAQSAKVYGINSATVGAIGIHSSVADINLFTKSLLTGKLVSTETLASMTGPQSISPVLNTTGEYYGYGWFLQPNSQPISLFAHTGLLDGYRSLLRINKARGIYYVILSNGGETTQRVIDSALNVIRPLYE